MKRHFFFASYLFLQSSLATWSTASFAETKPAVNVKYEQMNFFLKHMGYEDFVSEINTTLNESKSNLSDVQKEILKTNSERLQIINSSRELSAFLISEIADKIPQNSQTQDRLFQLIAKLLTTGPKGMPDELPPEIQNIKDPAEKAIQVENFIRLAIEDSANTSLSEMRADFLATMYDRAEIEQLERLKDPVYLQKKKFMNDRLAQISIALHSHIELAENRFLGRALALSTLKELRASKNIQLEEQLREKVALYGGILDNEVSSKFVGIYNQKGKEKSYSLDLKNGDLLTSYNRALEETQSVVKIYPSSWANRIAQFAKLNLGLQNLKALIPVSNKITAKQIRGEKLTWTEKIILFTTNLPIFRRGYNTVGLVQVKTDKESGLSATWVLRNLGNDKFGGIQFEDVHNFTMPGLTDRIGHTRLNVKALKDLNKASDYERFVSFDTGKEFKIPYEISVYNRLELVKNLNSQNAYEENVAARAIAMMKKMMTGTVAVGNDLGVQARKGLLSSAQTVFAAFKAGAGIDVVKTEDAAIFNEKAPKEMVAESKGIRFFSPSTWLWDQQIAKTSEVQFPKVNAVARTVELYGSTRSAIDQQIYAATSAGQDRISISDSNLKYVAGWAMNTAEMQDLMAKPPTVEKKSNWKSLNKISQDLVQIKNDHKVSDKEMRSFLFDLGFDNFAQEIDAEIKNKNTYNPATEIQQARNKKTYDVLNNSRELAILLMNQLQGRLQTEDGKKEIADLTAYLLSLQPEFPIKKIPNEILALPEEKQQLAMRTYSENIMRKTMGNHTRILTSDLLWHIYGDDIMEKADNNTLPADQKKEIDLMSQKIYQLSAKIIERMYMDNLVGQTRYLGRAFAALTARQAEVRNDDKIMDYTRSATKRYGMQIENFVGTEWAFQDSSSGRLEKIQIQNLSLVLNRYMGETGAVIPWGAQPDKSLTARAKKNGLIGGPLGALMSNHAESLRDGYDQIEKLKDQGIYKLQSNGFSHIGYAHVKESKDSKVKMVWVLDNYPNILADENVEIKDATHNAGGLRFVGVEQFYLTSQQSRFMVANQDVVAFYNEVQKFIKKNGIPQTGKNAAPHVMYKAKISKNGAPQMQTDAEAKQAEWTIDTDQETLNKLYSIKDPQQFWNEYTKLVFDGMKKEIKKGLIFHWITPFGRAELGGGYCSSTYVLASLKYTGFNPEIKKSRWIPLLHAVNFLYKMAEKINFKAMTENETVKELITMARMPIISPSSIAAQDYVKKYNNILSPIQEIRNRLKDEWSFRVSKNRSSRAVVDQSIDSSQRDIFSRMKFDVSEIESLNVQLKAGVDARLGKFEVALEAIKNTLRLSKKENSIESKAALRSEIRGKTPTLATVRQGLSCTNVFAN